jgi:hypothetical protein
LTITRLFRAYGKKPFLYEFAQALTRSSECIMDTQECKIASAVFAVYVTILKFSLVWKPQVDPDSVHAYTLTAKDGNWSAPSGPLGASAETILSQAGDGTRADFASKSTKSCNIGGFRKRDIDREAAANPGAQTGSDELPNLAIGQGQ